MLSMALRLYNLAIMAKGVAETAVDVLLHRHKGTPA